jgi:hypothetical protein
MASKPVMAYFAEPAQETASSDAAAKNQVDPLSNEVAGWLQAMSQVTDVPDALLRLVDGLRKDMEMPTGFRTGVASSASGNQSQATAGSRSFGVSSGQKPANAWRGRFSSAQTPFDTRFAQGSQPPAHSQKQPEWNSGRIQASTEAWPKVASSTPPSSSSQPASSAAPRQAGRYQSRFKPTGNIEDKILNTVIGNKLNAFTPLTYNDTRDFIYQIMDSGETEFTRDFVEKVFTKAISEDLYCALFAKLIAEIAHRYPVIYDEMNKYHSEFLSIFDDVKEDTETDYVILVKQKQSRMGYGQFMAELAGLNALEKKQLVTMVTKITDKIWTLSVEEGKTKTVEEFIDCLIRLTSGLRERSPTFFRNVKGELVGIMGEKIGALVMRSEARPSLSKKGGFGLMDLKEILGA